MRKDNLDVQSQYQQDLKMPITYNSFCPTPCQKKGNQSDHFDSTTNKTNKKLNTMPTQPNLLQRLVHPIVLVLTLAISGTAITITAMGTRYTGTIELWIEATSNQLKAGLKIDGTKSGSSPVALPPTTDK